MPGVVAVLTAADAPGASFCRGFKDQPDLAGHKVRFLGEAVALVVAESPTQAAEATTAVEVDCEVLPGCFDPEKALLPDAPAAAEHGNLCVERHLHRGDFEAALRQAAVVETDTYRVPTVDHAFLEPHGALAAPTPGGLTVWTSTKMVDWIGPTLELMLGLPPHTVRIIALAVAAASAASRTARARPWPPWPPSRTGRPVKLVYDREEMMQVSVRRHACVIECTHAADADGKLLGGKIDVLANADAYMADSPGVVGKHIHHGSGPYYIPNVEIPSRATYTNLPVTGAMRGYGVPQIAFAVELQMDALAEKLGLDPIEFRLRNVLRPGQTMATGQVVPAGTAAEAVLLKLRELLEREKEREKEAETTAAKAGASSAETDKGKGAAAVGYQPGRGGDQPAGETRTAWGVAFAFYGNGAGAGDTGRCRLRRESDGTYTLFVGIPDIGQGSTTSLAQIACQELGIPLESLRMVTADTDTTPPTGPAAATRVTVIVGRAVQEACRQMRACRLSRRNR